MSHRVRPDEENRPEQYPYRLLHALFSATPVPLSEYARPALVHAVKTEGPWNERSPPPFLSGMGMVTSSSLVPSGVRCCSITSIPTPGTIVPARGVRGGPPKPVGVDTDRC